MSEWHYILLFLIVAHTPLIATAVDTCVCMIVDYWEGQ